MFKIEKLRDILTDPPFISLTHSGSSPSNQTTRVYLICWPAFRPISVFLNTTFLEDYLTTDNLFEEEEEETAINPTLILDKSTIGTDEKMFFIELNKEVLIRNLELNEDGYYVLGTVLGLGKDVKL